MEMKDKKVRELEQRGIEIMESEQQRKKDLKN